MGIMFSGVATTSLCPVASTPESPIVDGLSNKQNLDVPGFPI